MGTTISALQSRDEIRCNFHFRAKADKTRKGGFRFDTVLPVGSEIDFWSRFKAAWRVLTGNAVAVSISAANKGD
jgi:hypothetical protein